MKGSLSTTRLPPSMAYRLTGQQGSVPTDRTTLRRSPATSSRSTNSARTTAKPSRPQRYSRLSPCRQGTASRWTGDGCRGRRSVSTVQQLLEVLERAGVFGMSWRFSGTAWARAKTPPDRMPPAWTRRAAFPGAVRPPRRRGGRPPQETRPSRNGAQTRTVRTASRRRLTGRRVL